MNFKKQIRVRFAPSPTGFLHIGGLRTALYNYLYAKKTGGTYILRIEDTDQKRFVEGAIEGLVRILTKMGVPHDEGCIFENDKLVTRGTYGPYRQSERLSIYKEYAEKLRASGHAYLCFCTPERLETLREEQGIQKMAPKYDKHCLGLSSEEIQANVDAGKPYVTRLNVRAERGEILITDIIRGEVRIQAKDVDDQVLMKSDGFATGVFALVVDDMLMEITLVIRGEEWLASTPKYILLSEALEWNVPEFAHLPLLLNPDKSKLSKRQGDVAVEDFLAKGYLEEALINFVALLGWNPGQGSTQEIFSLEELVKAFDLSHVHKSGAVFDQKKLDWMNGEYIKKMDIDVLFQKIEAGGGFKKELITNAPKEFQKEEYLKKVLTIEKERLLRLTGFGEENPFFFVSELSYDQNLLVWKQRLLLRILQKTKLKSV